MNVKVTGCHNCPFTHHSEYETECSHPNGMKEINYEYYNNKNEFPDWCPLNKEPITIEKV